MAGGAKAKLKNILDIKEYMKIAIDSHVGTDENGNYLINVAYLRVSTDKQAEEGYGLDVQEKEVLKYARINELDNLVLFIDDGWTGTSMDRPALNAIIMMIKNFNDGRTKVRLNAFIVPRIDRLGRTLLGTLEFIQNYIVCQKDSKNSHINKNKEDISFISIAEKDCRIDKEDPRSKFLLMLFATLAEFDRDMIVQKLQQGRLARIESGKWMGGGIPPYGYKYNIELGKLVVIPEEAEKVKEIFRLYIEEKISPQRIATMLGFKGERIVTQILQRKSSTGCIIYKGKEYPGEHQPIISLERWKEAQEEMQKRSVYRGESHNLLTGLIYCGVCGARYRYQKWDRKNGEHKLVCYSRQKSKPYLVKDENCDNELYWATDVEQAVMDQLFSMDYLGNEDHQKEQPYLDPRESLMNELKQTKKYLNRLYNFDDDDDDDVLKEKILQTRTRIAEIEELIKDAEKQSEIELKIQRAKEIFRTLKSTWPCMSQEERQAICRELIERIDICKNGEIKMRLKLNNYLVKSE